MRIWTGRPLSKEFNLISLALVPYYILGVIWTVGSFSDSNFDCRIAIIIIIFLLLSCKLIFFFGMLYSLPLIKNSSSNLKSYLIVRKAMDTQPSLPTPAPRYTLPYYARATEL